VSGVEIRSISVGAHKDGMVSLIVNVEVLADDQFEAIEWLVSVLGENRSSS
jgi:hypothetical protein